MRINNAFWPLLEATQRYKVLKGGAGSGKSFSIAQIEIIKLLRAKHRLLCLRKVQRTLRESVFSLFRQILNDWSIPHEANKVELSIRLENGSEVIMMGLDDVEKLKSVAGITRIFIEEATEITEQDFNQIDLRLRGSHLNDPSITLAFNPIDKDHWLFHRFFASPDERTLILETTYKDNSFLDEQYQATLESLKDRDYNYYKIYCLGEWGSAVKGLVFENWQYGWYEGKAQKAYGLDFGYSPDPLAMVEIGIQGDNLYLRQHLYKSKMEIEDMNSQIPPIIDRGVEVFCDHRQELINLLHKRGVNAKKAIKGKDSIDTGVKTMQRFNIFVHPDSKDLARELKYYRHLEDKDGNPIGGKYSQGLDHAIDACRYAVTGMVHGQKKISKMIVSEL